MASTITYTDKVQLNVNAGVPDINKVKATDMNEIKTVVNANATILGSATSADLTKLHELTATSTELNYVDGVTSAIQTQLNNLNVGWLPANETWTYSSVDDPTGNITISGDVTTKYSLGMRIKFTNGGNTIYGIITKLAYSSPNTTLTFLHQIDPTDSLALYLMANSTITANYYSTMKSPYGFPLEINKWTIYITDTTLRKTSTPTANTWYNHVSINIPIGTYRLSHNCALAINKTSNGYIGAYVTLSTANNSASDNEFTANAAISATAQSSVLEQRCPVYKDKIVSFTSKTTIYQNIMTPDSGINYIALQNNTHYDVIKAECIYL